MQVIFLWTKLSIFVEILKCICRIFYLSLLKFVPNGPMNKNDSIGAGNVLVSNRRQSMTWRNDVRVPLQWRHNERDDVSKHQPHYCLLNRLLRRRSKKTSKLRVTGLCVGISPATGEFPAQMASNAENVSLRWRHHDVRVHWSIYTSPGPRLFTCYSV